MSAGLWSYLIGHRISLSDCNSNEGQGCCAKVHLHREPGSARGGQRGGPGVLLGEYDPRATAAVEQAKALLDGVRAAHCAADLAMGHAVNFVQAALLCMDNP